MYKNKEIDHEKRKNQEGSYSPYNHIYNYLLNNYEHDRVFTDADKNVMLDEYIRYCEQSNSEISHAKEDIKKAISNFKSNKGEHGDTAHNLGKRQENSIKTIARNLKDLHW